MSVIDIFKMDEMDLREEGNTSMSYAMPMPSFEDYMQLKSYNRSLKKLIEDLKVILRIVS